ncbi:hypothetical protein BJ971_007825 [Actinoplanes digitatis]|uniref:Uncharacterized protein n=1 Tax=Actinoplanes digitatis TaxID=1868 RepID=A0A7W7MV39_9ACTN|nr:hypothetical protein [Actinoplanes digitatis]
MAVEPAGAVAVEPAGAVAVEPAGAVAVEPAGAGRPAHPRGAGAGARAWPSSRPGDGRTQPRPSCPGPRAAGARCRIPADCRASWLVAPRGYRNLTTSPPGRSRWWTEATTVPGRTVQARSLRGIGECRVKVSTLCREITAHGVTPTATRLSVSSSNGRSPGKLELGLRGAGDPVGGEGQAAQRPGDRAGHHQRQRDHDQQQEQGAAAGRWVCGWSGGWRPDPASAANPTWRQRPACGNAPPAVGATRGRVDLPAPGQPGRPRHRAAPADAGPLPRAAIRCGTGPLWPTR